MPSMLPGTREAAELKRCCAATYQLDAVSLLLGESDHPGGLALSRRLEELLGLRPGQRVADIASGPGATALALAATFGVSVVGLGLGHAAAVTATRAARGRGLGGRVGFVVADGEQPPLASGCFDAAICECALCTFPDKATGVAAMARVLRPGGRVGISDVVVTPGALPPELAGLAGWIGCLAGALGEEGYRGLLDEARLTIVASEAHDNALAEMVDQLEARLLTVILAGLPAAMGLEAGQVRAVAAHARQAVAAGALGYRMWVADKAHQP
jgi:arsenite methyltransferase